MKTRCKFYVTSVTLTQGLKQDAEGVWRDSEYAAIAFNAAYSPDPTTENHAFWKSSPSGSLEIKGPADAMAQFTAGSFWLIDIEQAEKGDWLLTLMEKPYEERLRVVLKSADWQGKFEVSIDNQGAWPTFPALDERYVFTFTPTTKE
jgi:hypothetical protein